MSAHPGDAVDEQAVVEITYRRTAEDVLAAVHAVRRLRPGAAARLMLTPLALALPAAVLPIASVTRLALLVAAALAAVMLWFSPSIGTRLAPARWGVGAVHRVVLSPAGFRQEGLLADSRLGWADVDELRADPSALLALRAGRAHLVLPRRRLTDADLVRAFGWWEAARGHPDAAVPDSAVPDAAVPDAAAPGALVVRGEMTPERARVVARGAARRRTLPLLALALLLMALAAVVGRDPALGVLDGVLALFLLWALVSAPRRAARRLASGMGPGPVTWTYDSDGMRVEAVGASAFLPWSRTRDASVHGEMLVLRTEGIRAAVGGLVGPLTGEQREQVLAWAAAGRGAAAPASRLAG